MSKTLDAKGLLCRQPVVGPPKVYRFDFDARLTVVQSLVNVVAVLSR